MASGMLAPRLVPNDHPPLAALPVHHVTVGRARERMAVHVAGRIGAARLPLICLAGYQRNMTDFAEIATLFRRTMGEDWPVVLVDLKGRGRSSDRRDKSQYISTVDAGDVAQVAASLTIDRAVFLGQGYGGQVITALASEAPHLLAGSILIDAGPAGNPHGLVRLRNNLNELAGTRSAAGLKAMFRRILGTDYPELPDVVLDTLAARTHYHDGRGRVHALFDGHLVKMLDVFEHDDVLVPQWQLFGALAAVPLMMMRTALSDQLRPELYEEMMRRRPDADAYIIEAQGSPALLNRPDDVGPIIEFFRKVVAGKIRPGAVHAPA